MNVAEAQFSSGIEGTVRDPTGAVVVAAPVTIYNENLGVTRDTTTNQSGFFRVTELAPGVYRVEVRMAGFKTWVQSNLPVDAREVRTVTPILEVGEVTTKVEVQAELMSVNLTQSNTSTQLSESTVRAQTLVGRNIYSLAALAPGIIGIADQSGGRTGVPRDNFDNEFGLSINAVGQRQDSNVFLVDGSYATSHARGGVVNVAPNPDTVTEMHVSANTFSAEKGRNSGALIEVVTKSGTNDWHGTLAWFHTNNHLRARTIFQGGIPVFQRNEGSFTVGGPINRNRTFFFGSGTFLRSAISNSSVVIVETPQFRDYLKTNSPNSVAAKVLQSAPPASDPTSNILTVGNVKSLYPGIAPPPTIPDGLPALGRVAITQTLPRNAEQWNVRVDHHFNNQKDRIYANIFRTTSLSADPRPALRNDSSIKTIWLKGAWTHTLSASLLATQMDTPTVLHTILHKNATVRATPTTETGKLSERNIAPPVSRIEILMIYRSLTLQTIATVG